MSMPPPYCVATSQVPPRHDAVAPGHVHPAVDGVRRAGVARLHRHEAARTQRHDADLVDHGDQRCGQRGIDGVAAGAGDLLAGVGRCLVRSGDRDVGHDLNATDNPSGRGMPVRSSG